MHIERSRIFRIIIAIILGGIVVGIFWFWWSSRSGSSVAPQASVADRPAFGQYFNLFLLGRPGQGQRVSKDTPLAPATTFLQGEHVAMRVQTAGSVTKSFSVELRILVGSSHEETASLRKYRMRLTIQPGLMSYCCVNVPEDPGSYAIGIVVNNAFIGYVPFTVKAGHPGDQSGFFAPL